MNKATEEEAVELSKAQNSTTLEYRLPLCRCLRSSVFEFEIKVLLTVRPEEDLRKSCSQLK